MTLNTGNAVDWVFRTAAATPWARRANFAAVVVVAAGGAQAIALTGGESGSPYAGLAYFSDGWASEGALHCYLGERVCDDRGSCEGVFDPAVGDRPYCVCDAGWGEDECDVPVCAGPTAPDCHYPQGDCTLDGTPPGEPGPTPGRCLCFDGWTGPLCTIARAPAALPEDQGSFVSAAAAVVVLLGLGGGLVATVVYRRKHGMSALGFGRARVPSEYAQFRGRELAHKAPQGPQGTGYGPDSAYNAI
jgi:hypothetical protein